MQGDKVHHPHGVRPKIHRSKDIPTHIHGPSFAQFHFDNLLSLWINLDTLTIVCQILTRPLPNTRDAYSHEDTF